jgi:hypothetical protein
VLKELVTALCYFCNAYTFRAKVDVERNKREKNLLEKIQKLPETVLIVQILGK